MVLSLTVITVVVGALLGLVASITDEPIAAAATQAQTEAIKAVAPEFDTVAPADTVIDCGNGLPAIVFAVSMGGQQVGNAVEVVTKKGFGGKVKVMVGFDMEGNITGYNVLDCSNETPGLGAKMPDWFQKGQKGDVIGMNPGKKAVTVTKDGGDVDAITAATISSRAFCDAIALAWNAVSGSTDAVTSATGAAQQQSCCEGEACPEGESCCQAEACPEGEACCGNCDEGNCQKPDSLKCDKCKAAATAAE